jgi:hypothetical protein
LLSLPPGTEMFQFPRFASRLNGTTGFTPARFPHSGTPGSTPACSSPRLFAACHALLRPPVPRHPLHALFARNPLYYELDPQTPETRPQVKTSTLAHTRLHSPNSPFNCQTATAGHRRHTMGTDRGAEARSRRCPSPNDTTREVYRLNSRLTIVLGCVTSRIG